MAEMKHLHEKKISELVTLFPVVNGNIAYIHPSDLKQWAIAIVKEYDKQSEECDPKTQRDEFTSLRVIIEFLIDKFELTKDDLKETRK